MHLIVCGALFRPPEKVKLSPDEPNGNNGLYLYIFKNTAYNVVCLHSFFIWLGLAVIYLHLPPYTVSLGYSTNQAATLISINGISNLIGRCSFGGLGSLNILSPMCLYTLGFCGAGICIVLCPILDHYMWLVVCSAVFGFLWGTYGPMYPEVMLSIMDLNLISVTYGYSMIFMAIGSLAGGPLSGKV